MKQSPELVARPPGPGPLDAAALTRCYQFIAEAFIYPEEQDRQRMRELAAGFAGVPEGVRRALGRFCLAIESISCEEHLQTLELSPRCPPYLGSYLFEEPTSCRGAARSDRNGYMIELANIYRHFGVVLDPHELPDYLPVVADFLWISRERSEHDRIGLRYAFIEQYVQPALPGLLESLRRAESPYALPVEALQALLQLELDTAGPRPSLRPAERPAASPCGACPGQRAVPSRPGEEVRP